MFAQNGRSLNYNYDKAGDVLYLFFGDKQEPSYSEPLDDYAIYLRRNIDTNDVTGMTIIDFIELYKDNRLKTISLPFFVDFDAIFSSIN